MIKPTRLAGRPILESLRRVAALYELRLTARGGRREGGGGGEGEVGRRPPKGAAAAPLLVEGFFVLEVRPGDRLASAPADGFIFI